MYPHAPGRHPFLPSGPQANRLGFQPFPRAGSVRAHQLHPRPPHSPTWTQPEPPVPCPSGPHGRTKPLPPRPPRAGRPCRCSRAIREAAIVGSAHRFTPWAMQSAASVRPVLCRVRSPPSCWWYCPVSPRVAPPIPPASSFLGTSHGCPRRDRCLEPRGSLQSQEGESF